jgi:RNA recognition motif-containing protein
MQETNKLFVGNLSFTMNEADLQETFGAYGEITDITIPLDRDTKKSKGFGFITFKGADSAQNALKNLDGKEFGGRNLRISIANSKEERGGSGGGGGRGGREGGGGGRY